MYFCITDIVAGSIITKIWFNTILSFYRMNPFVSDHIHEHTHTPTYPNIFQMYISLKTKLEV